MQVVIVFAAVIFAVSAIPPPQGADKDAQIVELQVDNIGVDGYSYSAKTSNGISVEEQGQVVNAGSENEAIAVKGSFSYVGPDGQPIEVTYVADENGFQPQGAHLPVPPS